MENNIYLLRFTGGTGGDFLAYQISKDEKFYPLDVVIDQNNTWKVGNHLGSFRIDLKMLTFRHECILKKDVITAIDNKFTEKNIILCTHWPGPAFHFNLPRKVPVCLTHSGKISYLLYFLVWIKRYFAKVPVEFADNILPLLPTFDNIKDLLESIKTKNFVYSFERHALKLGLKSSYDLIDYHFIQYIKWGNGIDGYLKLDVGQLYQSPKLLVDEFSNAFGMNSKLDAATIEEYFFNNVKLFESTFNKDFNSYSTNQEFLNDLREFVVQRAPDAYGPSAGSRTQIGQLSVAHGI